MGDPWFRRNARSGRGFGLPIHRNGWILLGAYMVYLALFPLALELWLGYPPGRIARLLAIVLISIPVLIIVLKKTAPAEPVGED